MSVDDDHYTGRLLRKRPVVSYKQFFGTRHADITDEPSTTATIVKQKETVPIAETVKKPKEKQSIDSLLKQIYTTPGHGASFTSALKIQKVLSAQYKQVVHTDEIQKWLDAQRTYSLHKRSVQKFPRNPIIAGYIDQQWQADLLFLPDLRIYNDDIGIALVCIDVVSKYAWVEPLRNKKGETTTEGMIRVLERAYPRKPEKFQTDDGTEFFNRTFQKLMQEKNINHFSIKSDKKASIAERFIRTIKEKIYRFLDNQPGNNRYIDHLQELVSSYNSTYHSSIKMAPKDVDESTLGQVLRNLYGYLWMTPKPPRKPRTTMRKKQLFKVDDTVRISSARDAFKKAYKGKWKEEVFIIAKAWYGFPRHLYSLKDWHGETVIGSFYEDELQKVDFTTDTNFQVEKVLKTRKRAGRPKECLVRWAGYSEKFDSWIPASDIIVK
jgi:hypothetical protein